MQIYEALNENGGRASETGIFEINRSTDFLFLRRIGPQLINMLDIEWRTAMRRYERRVESET